MDYDPRDVDSIVGHAERLEGRTLRDAMRPDQIENWTASGGKGDVGLAVEHYFDIAQNPDHEPDFPHVGVELKVAPMRLDRQGLTAKERVSITQINFLDAQDETFKGSALDLKTARVLFVFYEWEADQDALDARILGIMLWERGDAATTLARACHDYVRERVRSGEAHLLTSKHTTGIEPATKGSKGGRWTPPGGGPPARTRAFAFKRDFVHHLWRIAQAREAPEPEPAAAFREKLRAQILRYRDMSVEEINDVLGLEVSMKPKHAHRLVAEALIMHLREEDEDLGRGMDQLEAMGINPKVVRLAEDGTPDQTPPFGSFTFEYLVDTPFDESFLAFGVEEVMFIVWSVEDTIPKSRLIDVAFWVPDENDLAAIEADYEEARAAVRRSDEDALPGQRDARIFHVRTSGQDSDDKVPMPDGRLVTRRGFYMNKAFAEEIIRASRVLAEQREGGDSHGQVSKPGD